MSISAILMVHLGCTSGVLLVYFWKYTRNKDLKIRLGVFLREGRIYQCGMEECHSGRGQVVKKYT